MDEPPRPRLGRRPKVGGEGEPEVFCADEQSDVPLDLSRWQRLALDVLRTEGVRGLAELSVLYVSAGEMTVLNEQYMSTSGPTDVLAFPLDAHDVTQIVNSSGSNRGPDRAPADPGDQPLLLGDVVICPSIAAAQASSHAGTLDDELGLLLVHGILHVLGHDHTEAADTAAMRSRELALLEEHHWGAPAPSAFRQEQE